MKKSTDELLSNLKNTKDIGEYLKNEDGNLSDIPLCKFLCDYIDANGLKKSDIVKKSGIEKTYLYGIFRGEKENPSRDKVLLIALACGMNLTDTKKLLRAASCGELYARDRRDSVIIWCLLNGKNVIDTNILLDDAGLNILM